MSNMQNYVVKRQNAKHTKLYAKTNAEHAKLHAWTNVGKGWQRLAKVRTYVVMLGYVRCL